MKRTLTLTADGSYTLYVPELDEHYHSIHGANQEAQHVFIQHGIELFKNQDRIQVLEMGLGTCLNAFLTSRWSMENGKDVRYVGVEAYPVEGEIIGQCLDALGDVEEKERTFFTDLIYGDRQALGGFQLEALHATWNSLTYVEEFDLVYYDAFGPRAQAEMWTLEHFIIAFDSLKSGGLLTTYCAKGQVKRDLKSVGFEVESRPGPPGKREMTLAWKR
ncbi:MAG: tRNA (5-methylaminomethyl-2-thiouridine)(34)-methyltransferase MnmD [Bacteroidota bacterium]